MNKRILKKRIFTLFLMIFGFASLVFGQEKNLSFWVKGGLCKNYNYGKIVQPTIKPLQLTPYEGHIVKFGGIDIKYKKHLFCFEMMNVDLSEYGMDIRYDDNLDGFQNDRKFFESSRYYWTYSIQTAYKIWGNDYFAIYPKVGYQFQKLDCYSFDRARDWNVSILPPYEKRTCYSKNGHNIIAGVDFHFKFIPAFSRGNYFFSIAYAYGVKKISDTHFGFDGLDRENWKLYDENATIRRLSNGLFLQIGYKFRIY